MTHTIYIDGEAGTTGLEIRERLEARNDLQLMLLGDRRRDVEARREALNSADAVILCLPDDAAREAVSMIENSAVKIIDASTAYRVDPNWVYGFAEMDAGQREAIASTTRVSNPGCYPTGFIALMRPLVKAGLVPASHPVTVNAVSGYSGGGKTMIGVEVPLHLSALPETPSVERIHGALVEAYVGQRFVEVVDLEATEAMGGIEPEALNGTNTVRLHVFGDRGGEQVRLVAMLDNLGKGASGAAVQNLNIMLGLDEATGLK